MKLNAKKKWGFPAGLFTVMFFVSLSVQSLNAQGDNNKIVVIPAKELYDELKSKTLSFNYNQEIIITGVLKETGSSFIYNSSYLLISDKENGTVYVKAVLADKNKRSEYKNGQQIKIRARFYEEREKVVVVKDAKN